MCVGRRFAGIFMLAVGVHIHSLAKPFFKTLAPSLQLLCSVVFTPQAHISKSGCKDFQRRFLLRLGQTKRRSVPAKDGVSFLGVPRWVTHFKSERKGRRTKCEKVFKQRLIKFEIGWKLHKDGAEVVAIVQYAGHLQETLQRLFTAAQPLYVGDLLVCLQSKLKSLRNALSPLQEQIFRRHAVERMVDFNRFELPGIIAQHFTVRQLFWIKTPLPLLIGVSRSAHTKLTLARNGEPPLFWHLITGAIQGKGNANERSGLFPGSWWYAVAQGFNSSLQPLATI